MGKANDIHPDQLSADLAAVIHTASRSSDNREIRRACIELLTAANELLPLRDVETLTEVDIKCIQSALDWTEKGLKSLADLAVKLREGTV